MLNCLFLRPLHQRNRKRAKTKRKIRPRILATMIPTSWPLVKALIWAEDGADVDEVVAEVSGKDEPVEVREIEEVGVAVLEVKIEAELDKEVVDVVGVAVVVIEGIAVVVSGVEATGEVEPPNVHNDPNGTYSRRSKKCIPIFKILSTHTWTKVSQWQIDYGGLCSHWNSSGIGNSRHRRRQPWRKHLRRLCHISMALYI